MSNHPSRLILLVCLGLAPTACGLFARGPTDLKIQSEVNRGDECNIAPRGTGSTQSDSTQSDSTQSDSPRQEPRAHNFFVIGSAALGRAQIAFHSKRPPYKEALEELATAEKCLASARILSPHSYEVLLGTGIVHLLRARPLKRNENEEEASQRTAHLVLADQFFQRAYLARQGSYDPLYYLAEVRYHQEDFDGARALLRVLESAGAKLGPTYTLLAAIAAGEGSTNDTKLYWRKALAAGDPWVSMAFVKNLRVDSR